MFIGHFAPAFAAAAVSPRAPKLGTLFIAAQLVDWAFFILAAIGIEKMRVDPDATVMVPFDLYHMPYTHSMLGTAIWAILFGLFIRFRDKDSGAAFLAALVVASLWLLDFLTQRPDLTIGGGEQTYGLGLWNYPYIAMPLELIITVGAFAWYIRRTRPYRSTDDLDGGFADLPSDQLVWPCPSRSQSVPLCAITGGIWRCNPVCALGWE